MSRWRAYLSTILRTRAFIQRSTFTDLPIFSTLRDLRRSDLNTLDRVSKVITRRTGAFPQLKYVNFDCRNCGVILGPFYQAGLTGG
jgi:DNA replicative helicase MCM subunit Mcm2 (Cdc46/Mcm family)